MIECPVCHGNKVFSPYDEKTGITSDVLLPCPRCDIPTLLPRNEAHALAYGLPEWRECDLRWLAATLLPRTEESPSAANAVNDPSAPQQGANDRETNDE